MYNIEIEIYCKEDSTKDFTFSCKCKTLDIRESASIVCALTNIKQAKKIQGYEIWLEITTLDGEFIAGKVQQEITNKTIDLAIFIQDAFSIVKRSLNV